MTSENFGGLTCYESSNTLIIYLGISRNNIAITDDHGEAVPIISLVKRKNSIYSICIYISSNFYLCAILCRTTATAYKVLYVQLVKEVLVIQSHHPSLHRFTFRSSLFEIHSHTRTLLITLCDAVK